MAWGNNYAQYSSVDGRFTVDEIKGCAPFTVKVTSTDVNCPCDNLCLCQLWPDNVNNQNPDPSNNSSENANFDFTYTEPGIYELKVQAQTWGTGVFDFIQIEVVENTVPEFELTTCTANQVNVEIQDTKFDTYEINYNDGTSPLIVNNGQLVPTYTYASSGTKNINVRGVNVNAEDNCEKNNTKPVVILPTLQAASINGLALQSTSEAELTYSPQANTNYHLQIAINNETNFQRYLNDAVDPNQSVLNLNDPNLDFESNYYCFRIGTFDKCSNTYTGFSNTICSVDINAISVGNNELTLSWNSSNNSINEYVITKNTNSDYFRTPTTAFTDSNEVICNTDYCYRVIADYSLDGSILSRSLEQCATATSTDVPSAISDISVNVADPTIELNWELPSNGNFTPTEFHLFKDGGNVPDTLINNSFIDNTIEQTCYQIDYTDACFNTSELSTNVCSIYLGYQINAGTVNLAWNSYEGWGNGVNEYVIIVESNDGNISFTTQSTNFQLPEETTATQQIKVTIQAVANDVNLSTVNSNSIIILNSTNIQFPNAFIPDGINNTFNVHGRYIESVDVKIYNRWGELVATVNDKEIGWDGTINGSKAIGGTYVYMAEIVDELGFTHVRSGSILLIRK